MKKIILGVFALSLIMSCTSKNTAEESTNETTVVAEDSSENALDWAGTYEGTLPCASCPGIVTTVVLNKDNSYSLKQEYLDEKDGLFENKGSFVFNEDGSVVVLDDEDKTQFKVGENQLIRLDDQGNQAEGELKDMYILKKK